MDKITWTDRFSGSDDTPERFGLDKPAADLTLLFADGKRRRIRLGSVSALDGTDYVMVDNGPEVLKTSMPLKFALEKNSFELRSRMVLRYLSRTLDLIQLYDGSRKDVWMQVRRRRDGIWNMGKPLYARASPDSVQKMLDALDKLEADEIFAEHASPSESAELFREPLFRIKVTHRDLSSAELIFALPPALSSDGAQAAEASAFLRPQDINAARSALPASLLVRRTDMSRVYRVQGKKLAPFFQSADELRDWNALRFDEDSAVTLSMSLPDGKAVMHKVPCPEPPRPSMNLNDEVPKPPPCEMPRPWYIDGPIQKPVDGERGRRILSSLSSLKAHTFIDSQPGLSRKDYGLDAPRRTWTVVNDRRRAIASLAEGSTSPDGGTWFLATDAEGETQIFSATAKDAARLPQHASDLESATWGF